MKKTCKEYLSYFILFSLIGVILEIVFSSFSGKFIFFDQAIFEVFNLKIPFISFYGGCAVILLTFHKYIYGKHNVLFETLINGTVIILWELMGGLFCLAVYGHSFWDYSSHIFNFMGIISLPMSIFWLGGGFIFSLIYHTFKNRKNI